MIVNFLVIIGTSGSVLDINLMSTSVPYSILNNLEKSQEIDEKNPFLLFIIKATSAILDIKVHIEEFLEPIIYDRNKLLKYFKKQVPKIRIMGTILEGSYEYYLQKQRK